MWIRAQIPVCNTGFKEGPGESMRVQSQRSHPQPLRTVAIPPWHRAVAEHRRQTSLVTLVAQLPKDCSVCMAHWWGAGFEMAKRKEENPCCQLSAFAIRGQQRVERREDTFSRNTVNKISISHFSCNLFLTESAEEKVVFGFAL